MRLLLTIIWAALAALLCWRAYEVNAPAIERDILTRTTEAVEQLNADAQVLVDGRFVTVRGPEPSEAAKQRTLAAADNVWGALGPTDGLWVPQVTRAVEFFTAEKRLDGSLVLSGSTPSKEAKTAIEAAARDFFSGQIDNQLVVSGSGDPSTLQGVEDAFKSLASLDLGTLVALPDRLRLSGTTSNQMAADAASSLETNSPNLWQVFVKGPAPIPPSAPARLGVSKTPDGALIASGDVPSSDARAALLEALKADDPNRAIIDRLTVREEGLGDGWTNRALAGARVLTGLDWGNLSLEGAKSYLTGMAPQDKIGSLTADLGSGFEARVEPRPDDPDAARIAQLEEQAAALGTELDAAKKRETDLEGQIGSVAAELDAARKRIEELMAQVSAQPAPAPTPPPAAAAAAPVPAPASPPVTPNDALARCNAAIGDILNEVSINFETAKATITHEGLEVLGRVVEAAGPCLGNPALRVTIGGHTDSQGQEAKNLALSQDRAEAVKAVLVRRGVAEADITAIGFGESMPIADNSTADGRAKNRRITLEWTLR